jgi:hypothetical protein
MDPASISIQRTVKLTRSKDPQHSNRFSRPPRVLSPLRCRQQRVKLVRSRANRIFYGDYPRPTFSTPSSIITRAPRSFGHRRRINWLLEYGFLIPDTPAVPTLAELKVRDFLIPSQERSLIPYPVVVAHHYWRLPRSSHHQQVEPSRDAAPIHHLERSDT